MKKKEIYDDVLTKFGIPQIERLQVPMLKKACRHTYEPYGNYREKCHNCDKVRFI